MARKRIYLASPYGFSKQQKALLLPPIVARLEALGAEVWEPFRAQQLGHSASGVGLARGPTRPRRRAHL